MEEAITIKEILEYLQYAAVIIGVPIAVFQLFQNGKALKNEAAVAQAEFALEFMKDYAKPDMSEALRLLRSCKEYGENFSSIWLDKLNAKDPSAIKIEEARRRVKFYYKSACTLHKSGLITKKVFKLSCFNAGINLLYDVVEPLTNELDPEHDRFIYDMKEELGYYKTQVIAIPPN